MERRSETINAARTRAHSMRSPRILRGFPARTRAFTLLEALIATVIVAMVASAAAMSVAVGIAVQEQNRLSVIAMHAAELQMSTVMETDYDSLGGLAGEEPLGQLLAPARPGSTVRPLLPSGFSELSRTTTVAAQNRTFSQYNSYVVTGKLITVTVFGPDGTQLAQLVRYRGKEPTS